MKLTIFGASGGVGGHAVRQAVAAGHDVSAVLRDPSRFDVDALPVRTVKVSFHDRGALGAAIAGRDAVISAIGPRRRRDAGVATSVTEAIVAAMLEVGVSRIAVVSAAPVDPATAEDNVIVRSIASPLLRRMFGSVYADLRGMEQVLRESGLAWTSVRPPKLTNGRLTRTYRTRIGATLPRGNVITRADLADALLRAIQDDRQIGQVVGVAR